MDLKRSVNIFSICLPLTLSISSFAFANSQLKTLTDSELADVNGQALMSLSYLAPTDNANPMKNVSNNNVGFYKLGLEAELNLNANIKNLQLGCGGVNGKDACDIDIKNLALSGLPDSYDRDGVPIFNNGRASTSGSITNPFMEFAIANPNSASTREVKGIRFSAEKISALLSAGLENGTTSSTTDGIQRLSGFMQVAGTTGTARTQEAKFGLSSREAGAGANDQQLEGIAHLEVCLTSLCLIKPINTDIKFVSRTGSDSTGITVPSVSTDFVLEPFTVNGKRQTQAEIYDIRTKLNTIPIAPNGDPRYPSSMFANDQLRVDLSCDAPSSNLSCDLTTLLKANAKFKMSDGSAINNLNLKIDFIQSLSMFHNIPLTGTGGYLSLQDIPLLWPGAKIASSDSTNNNLSTMSGNTDVAQPGWWMSFNDPVQLGHLNVTQPIILDNNTLKQVAERVSETLMQTSSETPQAKVVGIGELISLLADQPLSSKVVANLDSATQANPVYLQLQNQRLANQTVKSNCYGTLKFC